MTTSLATRQSISDKFKKLEKYQAQLVELSQFITRNETDGVYAVIGPNEHETSLIGKKVDRELLGYLMQQYSHELLSIEKRTLNLQSKVDRPSKRKVSVFPEKEKKDTSDRVSYFSLPFFVTDVAREFFSGAKLGVANLEEYKKNGHGEAQFINGSDSSEVTKLVNTVYPGTKVTEDIVKTHDCRTYLNLFLESSIINNRNLGSLFHIYQKSNGLDAGKMKIHVDKYMAENLLDRKVDWMVEGKRLIEDSEIGPHRQKIESLIKRFSEVCDTYKSAKKDCKWWKEVEISPPKNKNSKGYVLYSNNSYESLYKKFNDAHLSVIAVLSEASDLVRQLFKDAKLPSVEDLKKSNNVLELKTPISILKKVLNHGKTFRQVMTEKRDGAFDESGSTYLTLINLVISYLRIPEQVSSSRLDSKYRDFVKSQEVIKNAVETDVLFKELKSQYC